MHDTIAPRFTRESCGTTGFGEVRFVTSAGSLQVSLAEQIQEQLSWLPGITDVAVQPDSISILVDNPTLWLPVALISEHQLAFIADPMSLIN